MMTCIPDPSSYHVLRHVRIGTTGLRLLTWETGKQFTTGQTKIGYALYEEGDLEPLFAGEDIGVSPMHSIDGDKSLAGVLGFLTVKPGDVDRDFFDDHTERQLDWCQGSVAEEVSLLVSDFEDEGGESPFTDIEG